jgi:hypothetical protein
MHSSLVNFVIKNAQQVARREIMKRIFSSLSVVAVLLALVLPSLADTIRLKDGSVIHGQVLGFKDQQFTILVGGGAKGRRSSITLFMEDVESIDFDSAPGDTSTARNEDQGPVSRPAEPVSRPSRPAATPYPTPNPTNDNVRDKQPPIREVAPQSSTAASYTLKARVGADTLHTGWVSSGLVVRKGQRLRITATGRILLGDGGAANKNWSTPSGIRTLPDKDKLLDTESTGALIAVIGDDNDLFFLIGGKRDFTAQRDGALYLGVNQGELAVSSGAYDVTIEVEAGSGP